MKTHLCLIAAAALLSGCASTNQIVDAQRAGAMDPAKSVLLVRTWDAPGTVYSGDRVTQAVRSAIERRGVRVVTTMFPEPPERVLQRGDTNGCAGARVELVRVAGATLRMKSRWLTFGGDAPDGVGKRPPKKS